MITFKLLHQGDRKVIDIYKTANAIWTDIFTYKLHIKELSDKLSDFQNIFEYKLSDYHLERWEKQEVFVISALTFFDNNSDSDNNYAYTISRAFELSWCSLEVKGLAKRFSIAFNIEGY